MVVSDVGGIDNTIATAVDTLPIEFEYYVPSVPRSDEGEDTGVTEDVIS